MSARKSDVASFIHFFSWYSLPKKSVSKSVTKATPPIDVTESRVTHRPRPLIFLLYIADNHVLAITNKRLVYLFIRQLIPCIF